MMIFTIELLVACLLLFFKHIYIYIHEIDVLWNWIKSEIVNPKLIIAEKKIELN